MPSEEKKPENIRPRDRRDARRSDEVGSGVGERVHVPLPRDGLVHGRVLFIGDSAHRVSPFGARGANGGVQEAENLAWKLAR